VGDIRNVLVVGGGIAGLTLAVALRRRGIGADIVELAPRWNVLGVGISLTGPTLRALKSIGAASAALTLPLQGRVKSVCETAFDSIQAMVSSRTGRGRAPR